jgi:hypothetical protein
MKMGSQHFQNQLDKEISRLTLLENKRNYFWILLSLVVRNNSDGFCPLKIKSLHKQELFNQLSS